MELPLRPYTNPWEKSGAAVSEFGAAVQQFGDEQQKAQLLLQQMVERRRDRLLEEQRAAETLRLQQEKAQREKEAAEREAALRTRQEKVRENIRKRIEAGQPLTRQEELNFYALEGLEPPKNFFSPEPEKPETPVNWVTETRPDGTYQINPRTGETRKVEGVPGRPATERLTPQQELAEVDASISVYEAELRGLPPRPKASQFEDLQAWNRVRAHLQNKITELRAKKAALSLRAANEAPAAPGPGAPAPLPDYLRNPSAPAPGAIDENDLRVQRARAFGYTDDQIRQYLATQRR